MTRVNSVRPALLAECRALCRYLIDADPSEYVVSCYERAWQSAATATEHVLPLIDRSLLRMARVGALPARMADAYARMFRPSAPLRRRLILLLAILENSPPSAARLNSAMLGRRPAIGAGMAATMLASAVCLVAGIMLLGPLHLLSLLTSRPR
ncbi:MAG TPA: hypothetical protein VGP61_10680 [Gemmatimonadales bacterium]|jgi:hypothetical protein|nr:hypothetical protein [Gemmatimonadales bacterium]